MNVSPEPEKPIKPSAEIAVHVTAGPGTRTAFVLHVYKKQTFKVSSSKQHLSPEAACSVSDSMLGRGGRRRRTLFAMKVISPLQTL
eukprot:scaffold44440_cov19-Tisochrysis_lutea.AAC.1